MGPQNPILIIKAPTVHAGFDGLGVFTGSSLRRFMVLEVRALASHMFTGAPCLGSFSKDPTI